MGRVKAQCWDFNTSKYINTKLFSPVIADGTMKFNPRWGKHYRPKTYREWWENERYRCLNGFEVGGVRITGAHYFYLNFWRIKSKDRTKGMIPPWFLDGEVCCSSSI
jgi:hypothetical protein